MKYKIYGRYQGQTEVIDETDEKHEAKRLVHQYRLAFGIDWLIWYN